MKDTKGKYDPSYLFRSAKIAVHHVREYGSKKYLNRDTWKKTDKIEYLKAAERHLDCLKEGEEFANDSNLPHLWHALCDIMFAIEAEKLEMEREENSRSVSSGSTEERIKNKIARREIKRSLYAIK